MPRQHMAQEYGSFAATNQSLAGASDALRGSAMRENIGFGPPFQIEQRACRQEIEAGFRQRRSALAFQKPVEMLLDPMQVQHVCGRIQQLVVGQFFRAPVAALLLLGDVDADDFLAQILESMPVGHRADEAGGDLGAIDRCREHAQMLKKHADVETPEMELGLLVDDVLAVETLPASQIQETTGTVRGLRAEYVRGIAEQSTRDASDNGNGSMIVVLDLLSLLADDRMIVRVNEFIDTYFEKNSSRTAPSKKTPVPSNACSSQLTVISTPRPYVIGPVVGMRPLTGLDAIDLMPSICLTDAASLPSIYKDTNSRTAAAPSSSSLSTRDK